MEDEATLRSRTKSNQKVTHVVPHKCLTICQQIIAVAVVLLENRLLQEPLTVKKPSTVKEPSIVKEPSTVKDP